MLEGGGGEVIESLRSTTRLCGVATRMSYAPVRIIIFDLRDGRMFEVFKQGRIAPVIISTKDSPRVCPRSAGS